MILIRYMPLEKYNASKLMILIFFIGYADSNDVLPVYIGDDRTDEDAFKVYIENKIYCMFSI